MTNPELFELMDRFEGSTLRTMKLTMPGFALELERDGTMQTQQQAPSAAAVPVSSAVPVSAPVAAAEGETVNAPLVGTFYAAPSPDQPPFAAVGDRVKKGQTVCLIEAMKMLSEVPAPCDCVIEAILKADGELAAFGEPLLRYTPC